jgi:hypothetical protein
MDDGLHQLEQQLLHWTHFNPTEREYQLI